MALAITTDATLQDAVLWSDYSAPLEATGGYEPYVWTIEEDLEGIFTLNSGTGLLFTSSFRTPDPNTVDFVGTHTVTVRVTDSHPVSPETITKEFTVTVITAPAIFYDVSGTLTAWELLGDSYLPSTAIGETNSFQFQVIGGTPPISWNLMNGRPGISISFDPPNIISVTPTEIFAQRITLNVVDETDSYAQITPWISTIASVGDPNVYAIGGTYGAICATNGGFVAVPACTYAWGGTPPYSFALAPGSDPLWTDSYFDGDQIQLKVPGFDTPPDFQTITPLIRITDDALTPSTYDYSLEIPWSNTPLLLRDNLSVGSINTPYSFQVEADDTYTFDRTFSVDEVNGLGLLPTGITMSSSGLLSGTTVFSNIFPITVVATTTGTGCYDSWDTQLYITAAIDITVVPDPPPAKTVGDAFNVQCSASGGDGPYTWLFGNNNPAPASLTINPSTGLITGAIDVAGTYLVDIIAQDSLERIGLRTVEFTALALGSNVEDLTLPTACKNTKYYYTFPTEFVLGGAALTYEVISGTPPIGLTLTSFGTLEGIPTEGGISLFVVRAFTTFGPLQEFFYNCTAEIYNSPVIQIPSFSFTGVGIPFEYTFEVVGGTAPFIWALSDLPDGMFFNSVTGTLYGTPTREGVYVLNLAVLDSNRCEDLIVFYFNVVGTPQILNSELKIGCQSYVYEDYILVSSGTPPYYWFVVSEYGLPSGLELDQEKGRIYGTPEEEGTWPVTIKVMDTNGMTGEKDFTLVIRTKEECDATTPGTIIVQKPRLISAMSKQITVADAFHQLYLYDYVPSALKSDS